MAYLIVRNVDVSHSDPHMDSKQYKRGYVTSVRAEAPRDQVSFGLKVLASRDWVIVHCPEMSYDEADSFCVPEAGDEMTNPMLRPRAFRIDPIVLPLGQKFIPLSRDQLLAAKRHMVPLIDPGVIGGEPRVIG